MTDVYFKIFTSDICAQRTPSIRRKKKVNQREPE